MTGFGRELSLASSSFHGYVAAAFEQSGNSGEVEKLTFVSGESLLKSGRSGTISEAS